MTLLVVLVLLALLFGGLGFAAHVLWWGLIVALVLILANLIAGRRR